MVAPELSIRAARRAAVGGDVAGDDHDAGADEQGQEELQGGDVEGERGGGEQDVAAGDAEAVAHRGRGS